MSKCDNGCIAESVCSEKEDSFQCQRVFELVEEKFTSTNSGYTAELLQLVKEVLFPRQIKRTMSEWNSRLALLNSKYCAKPKS